MSPKLIKRGASPRGADPDIGKTTHPSPSAPSSFFERDAPRKAAERTNVDDESDFGNCAQCGAPQSLSEAETCWFCDSDNRLNQRL